MDVKRVEIWAGRTRRLDEEKSSGTELFAAASEVGMGITPLESIALGAMILSMSYYEGNANMVSLCRHLAQTLHLVNMNLAGNITTSF
jgi:hypothetical protein